MSNYRLNFIERLVEPARPTRAMVRVAGPEVAQREHANRVAEQYRRLLVREGIKFHMVGSDGLGFDAPIEPQLLARLWNDAMLLVQVGRDLH